ncbi:MAG: gliding motility-associated C-terminal domain-containing protein [Flavobacteriales bacterium]|nr:gliding motility-associated C-terminal domain-containing protein [Flavobacteriales bacterium]
MNDGFLPITSVRQPSLFEFNIFDRWGQPVFSSASVDQAWDGKQTGIETPQGVYAWRLRLRDSENQVHSAQGHVVLLR